MKKLLSLLLFCIGTLSLSANNNCKIKPYGFVRNYIFIDSRESYAGSLELSYLFPKDIKKENTIDLHAHPSFALLSVTSRVGLSVTAFEYKNLQLSAKIEADFYKMSGSTATLRLRLAYTNFLWNFKEAKLNLKIGQAWHPMSELPYSLGQESGMPFTPFSRTPQLSITYSHASFCVETALLFPMQQLPVGPLGKKWDYFKHSLIPEFYFGLTYKYKTNFSAKVGLDIFSIKPRLYTKKGYFAKDRLTTISPYIYMEYKKDLLKINVKSILAEDGSHLNLISGYGVSSIDKNDNRTYTPVCTSVSFLSFLYGKKYQFGAKLGYIKNLGTLKHLYVVDKQNKLTSPEYFYFSSVSNINQIFRLVPIFLYNLGPLSLGFEYNLSIAQYGSYITNEYVNSIDGRVLNKLHWVSNNRFLIMTKLSF